VSHSTRYMEDRAARAFRRFLDDEPPAPEPVTRELTSISDVVCPNPHCNARGGAMVTFKVDSPGGYIESIQSIEHRYGCGCNETVSDRLAYAAEYDEAVRWAVGVAYGGEWTVGRPGYRDGDGFHSFGGR
jgi:hypothetical protein